MPHFVRFVRLLTAIVLVAPVSANAATPIGTSTTVASFTNPSTANQPVEFVAIVSGLVPSGTVMFADQTTVLCGAAPIASSSGTGLAYCTANFGEGAHLVTASYSGDAENEPSFGCVVQLTGLDPIWMDGFGCL